MRSFLEALKSASLRSALFLALAIPLGAAPQVLPKLDSLTQPVTQAVAESLLSPENPIPHAARLLPSLTTSGATGMTRVIVTLYAPSNVRVIPANRDEIENETRLNWIRAAAQSFVTRTQPLGFVASRGLSHLPVVIGELPMNRLAEIAADPLVRSIGLDGMLYAQRAEGAGLMKSRDVLNSGGGGFGVGVAILDTGIDSAHAELSGGKVRRMQNYTADASGDRNGHGTACAGIVAGSSAGMAPNAHLWDMKVLDDAGSGQFSFTTQALNDILANIDADGGIKVVSASLGGASPQGSCDDSDPALTSAMQALVNAGVTILVATGNEGCSTGVGFPACISLCIGVGAVYDADGLGPRGYGGSPTDCAANGCSDPATQVDQITCYSNSGARLDILAPSDCSNTTKPGGGYDDCFNGTSAATPYAAGVVAQLKSKVPGATPTQIRTALTTTGRPITDARNNITRNRVDAVAALAALGGGSTGPCVKGPTTLCLNNSRFRVEATWRTPDGNAGNANVVELTPDTGYLYFFSATNVEAVVKVLNACGLNQSYWVFAGGLTNVEVVLTVTDSDTGAVRSYTNPQGTKFAPIQDTEAFTTCP